MEKKFLVILLLFLFFAFLIQFDCSSPDDCDFNILGTWEFKIIIGDGVLIENYTFNGTETEGTVSGFTYTPGVTGTYTVSDCTSASIIFDYIYEGNQVLWTLAGNLISGTTMAGTLTLFVEASGITFNGTWSAHKL